MCGNPAFSKNWKLAADTFDNDSSSMMVTAMVKNSKRNSEEQMK